MTNLHVRSFFTPQPGAKLNSNLSIAITLLICLLVGPIPARAQTWSQTGPLATGRTLHTATLLANGKVLVTGGCPIPCSSYLMSAEIYDPATGQWSATGNMGTPRINHVAVRLQSGKVLVAGGDRGMAGRNRTNSVEL